MKGRSLLYVLILIAFVLAAVAFLLYRWGNFAEEQQKIYGAIPQLTPIRNVDAFG
jgi:hypothetical protein